MAYMWKHYNEPAVEISPEVLPGLPAATAALPGILDSTPQLQQRTHLVLYHRWNHHPELSKQPRASHAAIDGQMVKDGEPFYVDGEELMFPGDPNGSPGNTINCHCTMTDIWKEEIVDEPVLEIDKIVSIIERIVFPTDLLE